MDILLSVSKADAKCKLFDKNLLDYAIKNLKASHNLFVLSLDAGIAQIDGVQVISLKKGDSEMVAIQKFASEHPGFMLINRLALCNVNFENLVKYHENHDRLVTVVSKNFVKDKTIPIYKLNAQKEVISVTRKRFADCGIYLFKSAVKFDGQANMYSLISDLIDRQQVKGFVHKGYWCTSFNVRRRNDGKLFNAK